MAGDNENARQNVSPSDAEAAGRKAADDTVSAGAKPAAPRIKARGKEPAAATRKIPPAADKKTKQQQAANITGVPQAAPAKRPVSAPVPTAVRKPLPSKEGRDAHPFALWIPLIIVGVFAWFMLSHVQGPGSPEATSMVADAPSGAKERPLGPSAADGSYPEAVTKAGVPDSQPHEFVGPADAASVEVEEVERIDVAAGAKEEPGYVGAKTAAPGARPLTATPLATSERLPKMATSRGQSAAGDADGQTTSSAPSDGGDVAARPGTQFSSQSSTSSERPSAKAASLPKDEMASLPSAAASADPKVIPPSPEGREEGNGQSAIAPNGSVASEPVRPQPTRPKSTAYVDPNAPNWSWWPRAAPSGIYPYGPATYPAAVGRQSQSLGPQVPMNFGPPGSLPYYGWPGR